MFIPGFGRDPRTQPLYTPKNFQLADGDGKRVYESVMAAYPWPKAASDRELLALEAKLDEYRRTSPQTKVGKLMALEGINPDSVPVLVSRVTHIAVLDGWASAEYQGWREFVLSPDEPVDDFRDRESVRITRTGNYEEYEDFDDGPVVFEEPQEKSGPSYKLKVWRKGRSVDWSTLRVGDLASLFEDRFEAGEGALRAIDEFVFKTKLEGNAQIQFDGTTATLFATTHAGGANKLASLGAPSKTTLEGLLKLMTNATLDAIAAPVVPAFAFCRPFGSAHMRLMELLDAQADAEVGNSNNTVNLFRSGKLFNIRFVPSYHIDSDTFWALGVNFQRTPALGFTLAFLDGQDSPSVIDLSDMTPEQRLTRKTQQVFEIVFGGTWRAHHGIYQGNA